MFRGQDCDSGPQTFVLLFGLRIVTPSCSGGFCVWSGSQHMLVSQSGASVTEDLPSVSGASQWKTLNTTLTVLHGRLRLNVSITATCAVFFWDKTPTERRRQTESNDVGGWKEQQRSEPSGRDVMETTIRVTLSVCQARLCRTTRHTFESNTESSWTRRFSQTAEQTEAEPAWTDSELFSNKQTEAAVLNVSLLLFC